MRRSRGVFLGRPGVNIPQTHRIKERNDTDYPLFIEKWCLKRQILTNTSRSEVFASWV